MAGVVYDFGSRCDFEQPIDKLQLAHVTCFLVLDVAAVDGSDCLDACQGCFSCLQQSKAPMISERLFQSGVVALDQVIAPLLVDMPDAVKMWIVSVIDLADDAPLALCLVGADGHWAI
ncbi:hypothetical protein ACSSVY_001983 [Roseovarius sp. MBR-51]